MAERGKQQVNGDYLLYLAGPITGLSWEKAQGWYKEVEDALPPHIIAMKPLRGKEYLAGETAIKHSYTHKIISSPRGILYRDHHDVVKKAHGVLANLLHAKEVSIGTVGECAWCFTHQKPLVIVMTEGNPHWGHPFITEAGFVVPTLQEGIDLIVRLLSPI